MAARRIRTLVLATVAATGAALLATTAPATAGPSAGAADIQWGACAPGSFEEFLQDVFGMQCGTLEVPLDRADPSAGTITIAVSRISHTDDEHYQGPLLLNPGGPGGSGTFMPIIALFVDPAVAAQYDWIGFDPRGVGGSSPRLSCDADYAAPTRPAYVPSTPAIKDAWLARSQGYAADCQQAGGDLLAHMRTTDTVADMESIRESLGADQITYYGYSYGTYLGQVYATQHPDRVRRMILDSNIDARKVWERSNLDQDVAFEKTMGFFWDWVARYDSVYHLGRTGPAVERAYYRALAQVGTAPAGGVVGPAELTDIMLSAGYGQFAWPDRALALSSWVNDGDAQILIDLYGPGDDDNGFVGYLGVQCTDAPWSRDWSQWVRENTPVAARAPFTTWGNVWFNAPCAFWPVAAGTPVKVGTSQLPSFLLLDEQYDGATPFAGSLATRQRFPTASLIETMGGTSHAISPSGNPCTDEPINAYLRDGTVPARRPGNRADLLCAALPQPVPDGAAESPAHGSVVARTKVLARQRLASITSRG